MIRDDMARRKDSDDDVDEQMSRNPFSCLAQQTHTHTHTHMPLATLRLTNAFS